MKFIIELLLYFFGFIIGIPIFFIILLLPCLIIYYFWPYENWEIISYITLLVQLAYMLAIWTIVTKEK